MSSAELLLMEFLKSKDVRKSTIHMLVTCTWAPKICEQGIARVKKVNAHGRTTTRVCK